MKNSKLHIPITTEDKNKLKKKAEALGLTLSTYCLMVLKNAQPKILVEIPEPNRTLK